MKNNEFLYKILNISFKTLYNSNCFLNTKALLIYLIYVSVFENCYFHDVTSNAKRRAQLTCLSPALLLSASGGSSVVFFCALVASHKKEISLQNKVKE